MDRNPRHWLLISRRGEGKSTFGAQMSPEYLVCDLDGRWAEQTVGSKSHVIKESEPLKIVERMKELHPQLNSYVETVIIDSGTAVMDYLGARSRLQEAEARASNKKWNANDAHRLKADTLRVMRLAALKWHCDVLWIFHIEDSLESGKKKERTTISALEMDRMKSNLNAVLTIVKDAKGTRGIRIEWCRYNDDVAAGQIIWDTEGLWKGVPDRLDNFLAHFKGTEGYNGNIYSGEWLLNFLAGKGVTFKDVHEMYVKLDIKEEPHWFDRAGWAVFIEKALKAVAA